MKYNDTEKSLTVYLDEISKTPLLTPEEEINLAARVEAGDEKAREHMIKANLRLVVKIAKDYSMYGVPLVDLISEGNIGLMKAVDRYDPEKGAKLSHYAGWWIKQAIKRALSNQSKTIRLPVHMVDKIARMRRVEAVMCEELGRDPSTEELAEELGLPIKKVSFLKRVAQRPTSLDAPMTEGEGKTYAEVIGDEMAVNPMEELDKMNLRGELDGLLGLLDERESRIIDARFGLNGATPMTLEEVGRDFGLTRERIRQLQNLAFKKMYKALRRKDNPIPNLFL